MADDDRPRRSRFDQAEPQRKSRFDRRSASPSRKSSEPGRERSPVAKSVESPAGGDGKKDAAAAAAAAAAKINASISAKKGIQHVDVPPIRTVSAREKTTLPEREGARLLTLRATDAITRDSPRCRQVAVSASQQWRWRERRHLPAGW